MKTQTFTIMLAAVCLAASANALFAQNALWQTQNNAGWHASETGDYAEAAKQFDAAVRTAQRFPADSAIPAKYAKSLCDSSAL